MPMCCLKKTHFSALGGPEVAIFGDDLDPLYFDVSNFSVAKLPKFLLRKKNSKISAQELKEVGRDELTGVNLGQVDPATLQATKIACGAHMCGLVRCNYFRV